MEIERTLTRTFKVQSTRCRYYPISHLHYEFAHFEAAEMGHRQLTEALEADIKKVAVPCAEQKDLSCALLEMQRRFPEKIFLRIDGPMHEEAKRAAVEHAKTEVFDAIFFTASMGCGVSIDINGHDVVVFRLNERSTNADVAMQMCQRVRKLPSDKNIFVCNGRVKDWEYWPGYTSEKADEPAHPHRRLIFNRHDAGGVALNRCQ